MPDVFSWDYLDRLPASEDVFNPLSTALLVVFIVGFFIATFLYNEGGRYLTDDRVKRRYLRKYAGFLLVPLVLGLFFFVIEIVQIDPFTFGRPIWLYLSLLGLLAVSAWAGQDIARHYSRDVAAAERLTTRGRYINRGSGARTGSRRS